MQTFYHGFFVPTIALPMPVGLSDAAGLVSLTSGSRVGGARPGVPCRAEQSVAASRAGTTGPAIQMSVLIAAAKPTLKWTGRVENGVDRGFHEPICRTWGLRRKAPPTNRTGTVARQFCLRAD